jgi:hypothetical protein
MPIVKRKRKRLQRAQISEERRTLPALRFSLLGTGRDVCPSYHRPNRAKYQQPAFSPAHRLRSDGGAMSEKVETALNETRILVLIVEILIGFQFQSVFTKMFDQLPFAGQAALMAALGCQVLSLALLLEPPAYHRIVDMGLLSRNLCRVATGVVGIALILMAVPLGIQFAVLAAPVLGLQVAIASGAALALMALFFWWGLELVERGRKAPRAGDGESCKEDGNMREDSPLPEKIKFALTETRVVLPGAQALLGFQFTVILSEAFMKMAGPLKQLHLLSLAAVAMSAIFLMAPAAYHRIVEEGESSERVLRFTSGMLLAAMAFLALGVAGDVYVVMEKVFKSSAWAAWSAALTLTASYGLWFGYTLVARLKSAPVPTRAAQAPSG